MAGGGRLGWSALENATLYSRTWGDETLVYSEASGDTHLLGPVDATVLDFLQKGSATIPDLVAHIVERLGIEEDDELYFYVSELLDKLETLALAEHTRR